MVCAVAAVFAALLALALTVGPGSAVAATLEQKQSAARDRIEQTSAAIEAGRADLDAVGQKAAAASGREAEISGQLASGEQRSADLAGKLERAEAALAESKRRLSRARRSLSEYLVAVYMNGGEPDAIEMALGAGSFEEMANRTGYLSAIEEANQRLIDRVADLRAELTGRVGAIDRAKLAIDRHNDALASARDRIASVRAAAESSAASLASANAERAGQIESLKADITGWEKQIEKQQRVTAEQAEEVVEQNLGGPYSIPTYIVMCESGGNYSALNASSGAGGAYQIMPSTWEAYGGTGLPHEASKAEQDRIAALIWADSGASPWVCG